MLSTLLSALLALGYHSAAAEQGNPVKIFASSAARTECSSLFLSPSVPQAAISQFDEARMKSEYPALFRRLELDEIKSELVLNSNGSFVKILGGSNRLAKIARVFQRSYSRSILIDLNMPAGTRAYVKEGNVYLSEDALRRPDVYLPVVIHEIVHAKISNKNLIEQIETHWGIQFTSDRSDGLGSFYGSYFRLDEVIAFYKGALVAKKMAAKALWLSPSRRMLQREFEHQKLYGYQIVSSAIHLVQLALQKVELLDFQIVSVNGNSVELQVRRGDLERGSVSVVVPLRPGELLTDAASQKEDFKMQVIELLQAAKSDVEQWKKKFRAL